MRLIVISLLITTPLLAQVLDLGTIDNRKELLDQRFTIRSSDEDRVLAMKKFYEDMNKELLGNMVNTNRAEQAGKNINHEWEMLLEGKL